MERVCFMSFYFLVQFFEIQTYHSLTGLLLLPLLLLLLLLEAVAPVLISGFCCELNPLLMLGLSSVSKCRAALDSSIL